MPFYEYRCENGHTFEVTQRMSDDQLRSCLDCEAPVQRIFHPVAVHFKGSGFYATDYGKRPASSTETSGEDGKKESGEDGKKESGEDGKKEPGEDGKKVKEKTDASKGSPSSSTGSSDSGSSTTTGSSSRPGGGSST